MDRVVGLEMGADDYLPKPFEPREAGADEAILARPGGAVQVLRFGRLEIDVARMRPSTAAGGIDRLPVHAAPELARHAGRVMSREAIMDLSGTNGSRPDRSIDIQSRASARRSRTPEEAAPDHHHRGPANLRRAGLTPMKRLYRKIYLTILGSLVLVVVLSGLIWQFGGQRRRCRKPFLAGELITAALPPAARPGSRVIEALAVLRLHHHRVRRRRRGRRLADPLRAPSGEAMVAGLRQGRPALELRFPTDDGSSRASRTATGTRS
jgi:hypothetical protein